MVFPIQNMILVNAIRNNDCQTHIKENKYSNMNSGAAKHLKEYSTHTFAYAVINYDPSFNNSKMLNLMQIIGLDILTLFGNGIT